MELIPLTKNAFEKGVEFTYSKKVKRILYATKKPDYIEIHNSCTKTNHAYVKSIDESGFIAEQFVLGRKIKVDVQFSQLWEVVR